METALIIPGIENNTTGTATLPAAAVAGENQSLMLCDITRSPKACRKPYFKFYKVVRNDTLVTEILTNDFRAFTPDYLKIKAACNIHSLACPAFFLTDIGMMFYGFLSRIKAMEHAKAGALKYIAKLIEGGETNYAVLLKYRDDHYDDLNVNLTDRNIRKLEMAAGIYSN